MNAGPKRKEMMTRETVEQVLDYLRVSGAKALDLTGGAPELNMNFRYLAKRSPALQEAASSDFVILRSLIYIMRP